MQLCKELILAAGVSLNHSGSKWPDPTEVDLLTPEFNTIWQVIKTWDINVPEAYDGYCGATGSHVKAILDALEKLKMTVKH